MMMTRKTDGYFDWLCYCVGISENHTPKLMAVARDLYETTFLWSVPNDDNRGQDGLELRATYGREVYDGVYHPEKTPCTVFEMLVALAIQIDGIMTGLDSVKRTNIWFYEMIQNLDLIGYDPRTDSNSECIRVRYHNSQIVTRFLNRQYSDNGKGGLFPLKFPHMDQRTVEIWYQMQAYLNEKYG